MEMKEANKIIDNCKDNHSEHIGVFYEGDKVCLDGSFVIDEIEAILVKMREYKLKQSHDPKFGSKWKVKE